MYDQCIQSYINIWPKDSQISREAILIVTFTRYLSEGTFGVFQCLRITLAATDTRILMTENLLFHTFLSGICSSNKQSWTETIYPAGHSRHLQHLNRRDEELDINIVSLCRQQCINVSVLFWYFQDKDPTFPSVTDSLIF